MDDDESPIAIHTKDIFFGRKILLKNDLYSTKVICTLRCEDESMEIEIANLICQYLDDKIKRQVVAEVARPDN